MVAMKLMIDSRRFRIKGKERKLFLFFVHVIYFFRAENTPYNRRLEKGFIMVGVLFVAIVVGLVSVAHYLTSQVQKYGDDANVVLGYK